MRTFSFAVAAVLGTLCFGRCAHAIPVFDVPTETNTSQIEVNADAINKSTATISQTDSQIHTDTTSIMKNTAATNTILNTQTDVTSEFPQNDDGTVQNAMPASGITSSGTSSGATVLSALNFQSPGTIDGSSNFYSQNNTGSPGTDPVLVAQDTIQKVSANIQAMAAANLNALKKRLDNLDEMSEALSNASNITEINAINGRIAVESIAVQAEQAQAANLAALATAQSEINRENEAQAMRTEHTKTSNIFTVLALASPVQLQH